MLPDHDNIGNLSIYELISLTEQFDTTGWNDSAIELYSTWIHKSESPLKFIAWFNLGVLYSAQKELERAIVAYVKSLELNPGFMQARLNLGSLYEQLGKQDYALEQWRSALLSRDIDKPESNLLHLHALNNLGRLLEIQRQYKPALEYLEQSLALDPSQADVILHMVHLAQKMCRWPIYDPPRGMATDDLEKGTSPLAKLAVSDDPAAQLAASKRFVAYKYPAPTLGPLVPTGGYRHDRIRIGYLSSNLSMHAVSLLTVELFELHDRSRFEVFGFCWSNEDGTAFRQRVINAFDHFIKIGAMSDQQAAECIRFHEIDILVDLQGLTSGARPLILSYRPAFIQMTYLGFPGTSGMPWIDYVIADRYIIPEEEVSYYIEKPLYLPNCFQVSDCKRQVGTLPKRSDYSLPDDVFVFCSFNNNFKYTPKMFAVWMRILKRVPNSVLWLLADNEWAKENLVQTAKKQGVMEGRLIFAPREVPPQYLARFQLADLFLDTYPFNGGTTANDALFMGLPILTLSGRTFASRYAGSLLHHLEVPELISTSLKEYEERAVRLAEKSVELRHIREQLKTGKDSGTVFDTRRFVVEYEAKLEESLLITQKRSARLDGCEKSVAVRRKYKPISLFCAGHIPPLFSPELEYTMLCPASVGVKDEIIISDSRFGTSVDGASLAEYSQLFGLSEMISAGDIVTDNLFLFQYRKFISPNQGGRDSRAPWVRVLRPSEAPALFPRMEQIEQFQSSGIFVGSWYNLGDSMSSHYSKVHVIDDLILFAAACATNSYLTADDIKSFVTLTGMIPSPALCFIKSDVFVKTMTILKMLTDVYFEQYYINREGYQKRNLGYLLERLHSYLLYKWLLDGSEPNIFQLQRYVVTNE